MALKKFMQALDPGQYKILKKQADQRAIGVQELIRSVIVPEWLQEKNRQ